MKHRKPKPHPLAIAVLSLCASTAALAQNQTVEVIGTSPLPGTGVDRWQLPYTTELVRRGTLQQSQTETLGDAMHRRLPGVQQADVQGSPFQADLSFRGYRASSLLGAAQGLSVYLDGVRINEPFGDVIQWDMVPEFALGSVALMGGANPVFGLNALGGALALQTTTGRQSPGLQTRASLGSFGRQQWQAGFGQSSADNQIYGAISAFKERGWRDHSAGDLANLLLKGSRSTAAGEFSVNLLAGRSQLKGNGLTPAYTLDEDGQRTPDLLATRHAAVYTHPDETTQRLQQGSLGWKHTLAAGLSAEALLYVRHSRRNTYNGDEAEEPEDGDPNAAINRTRTTQKGWGLSAALSARQGAHQWQVGVSLDRSRVRFEQTQQEAEFDASRGVVAEDEAAELEATLAGHSTLLGAYATDTLTLRPGTHLTMSLRANQATVGNTLASEDDDTGQFTEHAPERFRYRSLNPALGLVQTLGSSWQAFGNLARNTRVPTAMELGCADPEQPCRLPSGLQADPYLKPVRATSVEVGVRGRPGAGQQASLSLYRSVNQDDIVFRATSVTGQRGFFQNFDKTRHEGLEAQWQWQRGGHGAYLGYSLLRATYQAPGVLRMGERNVLITPGTAMAGLSRHSLKAGLDWQATPALALGLDAQAWSKRTVAGNEDGHIENDEDEVFPQRVPGAAVLNARLSFKPAAVKGLSFNLRVTNLLNRRYATYGALAETQFNAQGAYTGGEAEAVFHAPGAPRGVFASLQWEL